MYSVTVQCAPHFGKHCFTLPSLTTWARRMCSPSTTPYPVFANGYPNRRLGPMLSLTTCDDPWSLIKYYITGSLIPEKEMLIWMHALIRSILSLYCFIVIDITVEFECIIEQLYNTANYKLSPEISGHVNYICSFPL